MLENIVVYRSYLVNGILLVFTWKLKFVSSLHGKLLTKLINVFPATEPDLIPTAFAKSGLQITGT
jgi:hypothetical protein